MFYYFNYIIKFEFFNFDNTLICKKLYESILIYNTSYKTNGFTRIYSGTRCLVLFVPEKYHAIYNRIRYPISQKSAIRYAFSHNYTKIN